MKQIAPNYTYNKTTGVITLTGVNIDRDQVLLIVNTTRNVTYYNFADSATTLQAFTKPHNDANSATITLNSSVVSASSTHSNSDGLVIYYDDKSQGSNELPYIKVNVNVINATSDTLVSDVYLRRIGEYEYESIRYQGNEDEAYLRVVLETPSDSSQKIWRLYSTGSYADIQGVVASILPQNAGNDNGDPFPPKTGWYLETGITGTIAISYEQPSTQPISGTVGTFNNTLVNAGTIFSYATAGNYGLFDAGSADYVEFRVNGGGGGFTHNIALSVGNSPFTTGAGTSNGSVTVFNDRYPSSQGDPIAYRFSNSTLTGGSTGTYVFSLWAGSTKYRYVRLDVTGNGGGSWSGVFNSYRNLGLNATSGGDHRILNRVPIAGVVDINSCTSSLPCTVSGTVNTYPQQGFTTTNSNFTSTTSATLVTAVAGREVLTVFNEGAGTLFINVGASCSTTSYQVRLLAGDYWEAPAGQQSLQHSGIFSSAGTARITAIS
jgi:hypothetical protein